MAVACALACLLEFRKEVLQGSQTVFTRLRRGWAAFWTYVLVLDYDARYQFSSTKEGYSAFTSLAGFAVAQSVALTAVAKDESSFLVITIYAVSVILTILWIWWLLRALRDETVGTPPVTTTYRAYDRTSITYGRCSLGWTLFVALIMTVLWVKGLLPNQTPRVPFDKSGAERCGVMYIDAADPKKYFQDMGGSDEDREALGVWIKWLKIKEECERRSRKPNQPPKRTVLIKQDQDFKKRYMPFGGTISCNTDYDIDTSARMCFLVRPDQNSIRPIFRQLAFRREGPLGKFLDTFDAPYADPGEQLFIIVEVQGNPVINSDNQAKKDANDNPLFHPLPDTADRLGVTVAWSR
jgi:hypothetical protein